MIMTRRRPGYALIELLVVMTVIAVMMILCGGMLHLLMKLDRSGPDGDLIQWADLARLARDFRADAHASATTEPRRVSPECLTLAIDDRTVEYLVRPRDLLRTVREGEKVRHYETYRRPACGPPVRLEVEKNGAQPFATLIVDRSPDGRDNSFYRDYRIEAELGKDRRLSIRGPNEHRERTNRLFGPMVRRRRRGLVSVAVLIALLVIGLVCAGLLKVALSRRAEVGMEERRLQAGWLAESGMDRAVARLMAARGSTILARPGRSPPSGSSTAEAPPPWRSRSSPSPTGRTARRSGCRPTIRVGRVSGPANPDHPSWSSNTPRGDPS